MQKQYGINAELENKIISKINELYITNRKKYLVLNSVEKKDSKGKITKSGKYYMIEEGKERYVPLNDSLIKRHIRGKQTIGVFSGKNISKFLCFDLDILDKDKLKWTYYLLTECLNELGIQDEYINVATSGNKGQHILIFIENGTSLNQLITLFNVTMQRIKEKISESVPFEAYSNNEHYGEFNFGKIEMRCTYTQGVKIELGLNFFNSNSKTNKCVFLDNVSLEPINDNDHILNINAMDKDEFTELMGNINDEELSVQESINKEVGEIKVNIQEPHSHKINKDEDVTISHVVNLIQNGLHMESTRHNTCLKIAKYFRYIGLELDECITQLQNWMKSQDKRYYSSTLEEALFECDRLSKIVYEKEYQLFGNIKNISIYKSEITEIIKIDNKYDKLLLYTMMIHSKRFALNNGVFYMTFKQIKEMCGISANGAKVSIKRLEDAGYLKVVSRNVRQENNYKHLPNRYMITLNIDSVDDVILEIDNTSNTLSNNELYYTSVTKAFTNDELKHLPDRQYREFSKFRKSMVS